MLNPNARHDPQDLTKWGRAAAVLYLNKALPLSNAVYEVVKDKELTAEHLKRIYEVANITAYLAEYDRMAGPSRVVSFAGGPATFDKILSLTGEASGDKAMLSNDYEEAPLDYKVAKALYDGRTMQKAASEAAVIHSLDEIQVGVSGSNTLESLYYKLGSAVDRTRADLVKLSALRVDLYESLYGMVKDAVLSGYSLGEIRRAACDSADVRFDRILLKTAQAVSSVFHSAGEVEESFKKVSAQKEVDRSHPLRARFDAYKMVLDDIQTKTAALEILRDRREHVWESLKGARNG